MDPAAGRDWAGLDALAGRLRDGDPDRFGMALMVPAWARPRLLTLYALNLELARTALSAREPLIAQMRVQWWADRLAAMADAPPPPHELLSPLWQAWGAGAAALMPLAEARRRDAERTPFLTAADAADYAAATGGTLMALAAGVLGAPLPVARDQGTGGGIAAWLAAEPQLAPLSLGFATAAPELRAELAGLGLAALARAREGRRQVPRQAAGVLYAGDAGRDLAQRAAGRQPAPRSELRRRWLLARCALAGRWWMGG